jgi:DNA-binding MarR family transcriptional regulator
MEPRNSGRQERSGEGNKPTPARETPPELNRLIHEPARLKLMALLFVVNEADFTFLMSQTGLSWGNLSSHMSKLEGAGYIDVKKSFVKRRPRTLLKLTEEGRSAFHAYREDMQQILDSLPDESGP